MRGIARLAVSDVFLGLGRLLSVLLLLFWGAFFVEHLTEWFIPHGTKVPGWVWVAQGFHLLMLVGLGVMSWREKPGAVIMALGTVLFFSSIGLHRFPLIALLNVLPLLAFAASWATARRGVLAQ